MDVPQGEVVCRQRSCEFLSESIFPLRIMMSLKDCTSWGLASKQKACSFLSAAEEPAVWTLHGRVSWSRWLETFFMSRDHVGVQWNLVYCALSVEYILINISYLLWVAGFKNDIFATQLIFCNRLYYFTALISNPQVTFPCGDWCCFVKVT